MFCPVKHEHFARNGLRRNQVGVLRHVSRAVDFARMIDSLNYLEAGLGRETVASQLAAFIVVVAPVKLVSGGTFIALRKVHSRDLEVILRLARRMRSEQQSVDSVWFVRGSMLCQTSGQCGDEYVVLTTLCQGTIDTSDSASPRHG